MTTTAVEQQIRDLVLVLIQVAKHHPLPDDVMPAMNRLTAALRNPADDAARHLEALRARRTQLTVKRGGLVESIAGWDWLASHPAGQNALTLRRAADDRRRAAEDLDVCAKELARVETEIAGLTVKVAA